MLIADRPSWDSDYDSGLRSRKLQAMQLILNDVSFWYRDKTALAIAPNEFTGRDFWLSPSPPKALTSTSKSVSSHPPFLPTLKTPVTLSSISTSSKRQAYPSRKM